MRSRRWISGRRSRIGIAVALAALACVLVAFAVILINQQQGDRNDIKDGFRDRAAVSAALTQSLFEASSTAGAAENSRRYGTATVPTRRMAAAAKQGQAAYVALVGADGSVIAHSPGTPRGAIARLGHAPSDIRAVRGGKPYSVTNLLRFSAGLQLFELATPVNTRFGQRVLVTGVSPELLAVFLGGYLQKVPRVEGGAAYILDGTGASIAATGPGAPPGSPPQVPGLTDALATGSQGSFGDGRYFVSVPVGGTPWKVVSTAPESNLFASVTGAHKWVPWLIFALFAVASGFAIVLLSRVLRNADQLAEANQQLEEVNLALERRAGELGRSNAELEQFASIASHDLKEPLRKMQTFIEQLAQTEADELSEKGRDYLQRASNAGQRMQSLIDDLLKFSRVATQGQPFELVDLGELARHAVSDLEAVIAQSGGSVEVGEMPTVPGDPLQMRQLIQNLLSNGIKFHREGVPPRVRISGRADARFAEFEVTDNGIGFERRYETRIFKVFERLHGRSAYPGTGIGLALCRKIVDRHGGTITVDSTPGEGSTFKVVLPLAKNGEPLGAPAMNGEPDHEESRPVHV